MYSDIIIVIVYMIGIYFWSRRDISIGKFVFLPNIRIRIYKICIGGAIPLAIYISSISSDRQAALIIGISIILFFSILEFLLLRESYRIALSMSTENDLDSVKSAIIRREKQYKRGLYIWIGIILLGLYMLIVI